MTKYKNEKLQLAYTDIEEQQQSLIKIDKISQQNTNEVKGTEDKILVLTSQGHGGIEGTTDLFTLFQKLNQITQCNGEFINSNTLTIRHSILVDIAHIIHPALSSITIPASAIKEKAIQGSRNYIQAINELLHDQELDKPIVMDINTASVHVALSTDIQKLQERFSLRNMRYIAKKLYNTF